MLVGFFSPGCKKIDVAEIYQAPGLCSQWPELCLDVRPLNVVLIYIRFKVFSLFLFFFISFISFFFYFLLFRTGGTF